MSDKCRFCGAIRLGVQVHDSKPLYACGDKCKDSQIAALKAELADREERLGLWRKFRKGLCTDCRFYSIASDYDKLKAKGEI